MSVESEVLLVSPSITPPGVIITSGLGVLKAGSSEKPGGWTGLVRVGYGESCAVAREMAASTMVMEWRSAISGGLANLAGQ